LNGFLVREVYESFTDEKTFTLATPVNSRAIEIRRKFKKGNVYENANISAAVSWY